MPPWRNLLSLLSASSGWVVGDSEIMVCPLYLHANQFKSLVTAIQTNDTLICGFSLFVVIAAALQGNWNLSRKWTNLPIYLPIRMCVRVGFCACVLLFTVPIFLKPVCVYHPTPPPWANEWINPEAWGGYCRDKSMCGTWDVGKGTHKTGR